MIYNSFGMSAKKIQDFLEVMSEIADIVGSEIIANLV